MKNLCDEGVHDWESGTFGVIIGVSKCKRCGKTSKVEDFTIRETEHE